MNDPVPVTFEPSGLTVWVEAGTTLLEAAGEAGVVIAAPCGGRAVCGACGVRVLKGRLAEPDAEEARCLSRSRADVRLACRACVSGAVTVQPLSSAPATRAKAAEVGIAPLAVGVDLGTTSVSCRAIELDGGHEFARGTAPNRQQRWGADVLSRLSAALEGDAEDLRAAAKASVADALAEAGVAPARIERMVVAGNSAMAGLFAGAEVQGLAVAPFAAPAIPRQAIGGANDPWRAAEVFVVPTVAGFVGGDTLAGLSHTGMLYAEEPSLLVDLGTNAEIALASRDRLCVASAAAGPAFEGVGIECGGPAAPGSISKVELADDGGMRLKTVGDAEPCWLNGAGMVSVLSLLLETGHLTADGSLVSAGPLARHFAKGDDGVMRFAMAGFGGGRALSLSQLDVRAAQLAKAAVRVAVAAVLRQAGVDAGGLAQVNIAGAFGGAVVPEDLVSLGMLPSGVAPVTRWVGNAALNGAVEFALDPRLLGEAADRAVDAVHVDLAGTEHFDDELISALELAPFDA